MIPEEGQIVDLVRLRRSLEELEARQALSPKTFQAGTGRCVGLEQDGRPDVEDPAPVMTEVLTEDVGAKLEGL